MLNFFVLQKYLFITLDSFLVIFHFRISSLIRVIKKGLWFELLLIGINQYFQLFVVPPVYGVALFYIASTYFLTNFALSHTHLPATVEPVHWVEYSLTHTCNVKSGLFNWVDWWMGYLNYQIEHHLFPAMPQFRNKLIRHKVKALAAKHGLPYIVLSYTDAVKTTFKNLDLVSKELK